MEIKLENVKEISMAEYNNLSLESKHSIPTKVLEKNWVVFHMIAGVGGGGGLGENDVISIASMRRYFDAVQTPRKSSRYQSVED